MNKLMKVIICMSVMIFTVSIANAQPLSLLSSIDSSVPLIDSVGFDVQYSTALKNVVESETHKHRVTRYIVRAGRQISTHWELGGEFHYSQHSSSPKVPSRKYYKAKETGVNLVIHYNLGDRSWVVDPYIGWVAGLSWLVNKKNQPNWADSGCLGSFGPTVGLNIPVYTKTEIRLEGRITHTSDPFGSDSGRNMKGVSLGLTYYF